ncbi:hypothetical protein OSC27_07830 [Microbacterium sp. STN6]|uniref:hypothetical protein n=1 Tax=Microbacterium sp. STN6 TaxID=2995588 RepID=UPI002260E17E|nr:hypothetical protein [Microbacterium sp. STN6]MCX7522186.1 hypothetical protein [Microbacterium sp. STN6]
MQWLNDFFDWFTSTDAQPVVFSAVVLAVAIIVSGLLAAWISRGTVRSMLAHTERAQKASAIATLVDAATEASVWNSLTPQEQVLSDRAVGQADTLVRLLPIRGAGTAANWASHQLAEMKRNSATFGYQLDPAIAEFRERLIDWQMRPAKARRVFQADLDRWRYDNTDTERSLLAQQDAWVAQQHHQKYESDAAPAATDYTAVAPVPEPVSAASANPGLRPTGPSND